jgi:hypothetical protein
MATTQLTLTLRPIIDGLIEELGRLADTQGNVRNDDIVGSFQNVVMLDFGVKVDDLPKELQDLYYRSRIDRPKTRNFETLRRHLDHMSR